MLHLPIFLTLAAGDGVGSDLYIYLALAISVLMFGAATALALAWAFRNGQLENFHRGATSIFDPDEPVGEVTDRFPTARRDSHTEQ